MSASLHLFAVSIYDACGLSVVLGVGVFIRNAVRRRDVEYEARFPWWARLFLYLSVFVLPPVLFSAGLPWLNTSFWTNFVVETTALAIPFVGLLVSLWLCTFRTTRERTKLAKGLLFVSLILIIFLIGVWVDPTNSVVY